MGIFGKCSLMVSIPSSRLPVPVFDALPVTLPQGGLMGGKRVVNTVTKICTYIPRWRAKSKIKIQILRKVYVM